MAATGFPLPHYRYDQSSGKRSNKTHMVSVMHPSERVSPAIPGPSASPAEARAARVRYLADLVVHLNVEKSVRWAPHESSTYCDHYTMDFLSQWCGRSAGRLVVPPLSGWLWWNTRGLAELAAGRTPAAIYPTAQTSKTATVLEHGATSMFKWLVSQGEGAAHGWVFHKTAADLQSWCNEFAAPGIIFVRNANPKRASHITVALPDAVEEVVVGKPDADTSHPLQTEAGSKLNRLTRRVWYTGDWVGAVAFASLGGDSGAAF